MLAKLWHIYLVKKPRHTKGRRKRKYVAIVLIDVVPMGFYINSERTDWIRQRPKFWPCEANILAEEHSCLEYNSIVDCQQLYQFAKSELTAVQDKINDKSKREILDRVLNCP